MKQLDRGRGTAPESPLLSVREAAGHLRVSPRSLETLISAGRVPVVRLLRRRRLIRKVVLDAVVRRAKRSGR